MADATATDLRWAATSSSCEGNAESCQLLYSYGTCGSADIWSGGDGNKEAAYVKMKRDFLTLGVLMLLPLPPVPSIHRMLLVLQQ